MSGGLALDSGKQLGTKASPWSFSGTSLGPCLWCLHLYLCVSFPCFLLLSLAFPLTRLNMGPHYSFALVKSSIYMFNLRLLHAFFLTISQSFGSKMCIDYCLEMNVHMCRVGSGWLQLERGDQVEDSSERGS